MSVTKGVIWGAAKVGKTTLLKSLPAAETLVIDVEAGLKSVQGTPFDCETIRNWEKARALACYIGGADPALSLNDPNVPYSAAYYKLAIEHYKEKFDLNKYKYLFVDSITVASQLCKKYCVRDARSFTEKGKLDNRKVFGLIADEMIAWLTHLQHIKTMNVWLVGRLVKTALDSGEVVYVPELEGAKTKDALAGLVDEILTMTLMHGKDADGKDYTRRVFVTSLNNMWGFPAGDRSGCLDLYEPAHLGNVTEKINSGKAKMHIFDETPIEMDEIVYLR